jgi:hypothetical protein
MEDGWVKIYVSAEEYQAVLIKDLLENHGLHPVYMDKRDDEFRLGEAQVYVAPEEVEQAQKIIKENQS